MKRPLVVSVLAFMWGIILADVNISYDWGILSVLAGAFAIALHLQLLQIGGQTA